MGKKREKKGEHQQHQNPNIAEATRIRISQILQDFRAAKDEVYTFEANLTNHERAVVHDICRKIWMISKSSGRGKRRRVSVYKTKNKVNTVKGKESPTSLTFSEEAMMALELLFMHYPPDDGETGEKLVAKQGGENDKRRGKRDDFFSKPSMSKEEIAKKLGITYM